jgi:hypothetical protein
MLQTLIGAMAGRVPNASVIFVDQAGRRVYADRMGATYADTGVAAPSLSELLGTDPTVVGDLVTLRPTDLGLGDHRSRPTGRGRDRGCSRRARAGRRREGEARDRRAGQSWEAELATLDELIAQLPEEQARWNWMLVRDRLDALRAELAALDVADGDDDDGDRRGCSKPSRSSDQPARPGPRRAPPRRSSRRARPAAPGERCRPGPRRSDPRAAARRPRRARGRSGHHRRGSQRWPKGARGRARPAADPGDGIVYQLAQLDQDRLWACVRGRPQGGAIYEAELAERQGEVDPVAERHRSRPPGGGPLPARVEAGSVRACSARRRSPSAPCSPARPSRVLLVASCSPPPSPWACGCWCAPAARCRGAGARGRWRSPRPMPIRGSACTCAASRTSCPARTRSGLERRPRSPCEHAARLGGAHRRRLARGRWRPAGGHRGPRSSHRPA